MLETIWYIISFQWKKLFGKQQPTPVEQMRLVIDEQAEFVLAAQRVHEDVCRELKILTMERDALQEDIVILTKRVATNEKMSSMQLAQKELQLSCKEEEITQKIIDANTAEATAVEHKNLLKRAQTIVAQIQTDKNAARAMQAMSEFKLSMITGVGDSRFTNAEQELKEVIKEAKARAKVNKAITD